MTSQRLPELVVEGPNDQHTLSHLLEQHGIRTFRQSKPPKDPPPGTQVLISFAADKVQLLEQIPVRVLAADSLAIGFVIDSDSPLLGSGSLAATWQSVCQKLQQAGVAVAQPPNPAGNIVSDPSGKLQIGFWLMPDNQRDGTLEDFLGDLIVDGNTLIDFAEAATKQAQAPPHNAAFASADFKKAHLACWLAWQQEPGRPYGTAIKNHYFRPERPLGISFVAWVKLLCGIP